MTLGVTSDWKTYLGWVTQSFLIIKFDQYHDYPKHEKYILSLQAANKIYSVQKLGELRRGIYNAFDLIT